MSTTAHCMYQRSADGLTTSWTHSVLPPTPSLFHLAAVLARTVIVIAFHLKADDLGVELNHASSGQSRAPRW